MKKALITGLIFVSSFSFSQNNGSVVDLINNQEKIDLANKQHQLEVSKFMLEQKSANNNLKENDKYLNNDGTISDEAKRQYFLAVFNKNKPDGVFFSIEDKCFVIVTKDDCGDKKYENKEMRKRALYYSFYQLLDQITVLKKGGYKEFLNVGFEGIIFKTNTICMDSTRRYNFKFSISELDNFPEYMDFDELYLYVVGKNQNKNIILVKND